jgi:hypothetical protein
MFTYIQIKRPKVKGGRPSTVDQHKKWAEAEEGVVEGYE